MKNRSPISQRIVEWNARSWHVPISVVSVVLGLFLAGLIVALAVPLLPRGTLRGWTIWLVIGASISLVAAVQLFAAGGGQSKRRDVGGDEAD